MNDAARRPLKVRNLKISIAIAQSLSKKNITPNQISIISIVFAVLAAGCYILFGLPVNADQWWLMPLAAFFIQLRLLCNLFDGMVAMEGGKTTKSGELYNDIPDRIADPLILVSAGYAISYVSWAVELAWFVGLMSVMTAYIRTLSASIGAPVDFQGPMAKQHRMAVLTVASVLAAAESYFLNSQYVILGALVLIASGSIVTSIRRAIAAYHFLESR